MKSIFGRQTGVSGYAIAMIMLPDFMKVCGWESGRWRVVPDNP
jgi:hypothetical protein